MREASLYSRKQTDVLLLGKHSLAMLRRGGSTKASVISAEGSRPRHNLRYYCHRHGLVVAGGALLLAGLIGILIGEELIE